MSLLLTLEQGPRDQAVHQTRLDTGELVIGRSPDADWQIDDPDMFVSRAHCKITGGQDGYFVTDMSSSGLFINDAGSPLGSGNSTRLHSGMRLRLGDYVVWVDMQTGDTQPPAPSTPQQSQPVSRPPVSIGRDDFFSMRTEEEPRRPRPAELPDPFEQPRPGAFERAKADERSSPAFDDPFSLDPAPTPIPNPDAGKASGQRPSSDPFGLEPAPSSYARPAPADLPTPARDTNPGSSNQGPAERRPTPVQWEMPARAREPAAPPARATSGKKEPPQPHADDIALRAAFLRGMGLDQADFGSRDPVAEMEKFGREYRMMMDGLMQLLRKRSEEKGNARVAQTVVGASEVNPLKFLPTVDDALSTILAERSPGFLAGEPAIADAIRDLAHHHVRAWRGVQGALRRMIDRFDPAAIEEELKSDSALGTLLSGGRNAKLWQLYQKRHREIAQSAETRFLGEIGADFRDAYEEE